MFLEKILEIFLAIFAGIVSNKWSESEKWKRIESWRESLRIKRLERRLSLEWSDNGINEHRIKMLRGIDRNERNAEKLKYGMSKDEVKKIMGNPKMKKGGKGGYVWKYRTETKVDLLHPVEEDYLNLYFSADDRLESWEQGPISEHLRQ